MVYLLSLGIYNRFVEVFGVVNRKTICNFFDYDRERYDKLFRKVVAKKCGFWGRVNGLSMLRKSCIDFMYDWFCDYPESSREEIISQCADRFRISTEWAGRYFKQLLQLAERAK